MQSAMPSPLYCPQATSTEAADGCRANSRLALFPFIQNLCTSSANSSNSCSVGLTSSLTGTTITTFANNLASQLDNGVNTTLGSGGTHFENALSSMNSFITSVGTGSNSSNALPYVFIVTDGSQDYQTQSGGNWSSQNWTANATVPYTEFRDHHPAEHRAKHQLLHDDEKSRDHDRHSLHSLWNHRGSPIPASPITKTAMPTTISRISRRLFRIVRQLTSSTPPIRPRTSKRADHDVRAGGHHRTHYAIAISHRCAAAIVDAQSASARRGGDTLRRIQDAFGAARSHVQTV